MAENEIPYNADKVLFAEDLVTYVMSHYMDIDNPPCSAEPYREFVYNGFHKAMKIAVAFNENGIQRMWQDGPFDDYTYIKRANEITHQYFPHGFNVSDFLRYCIHLAVLAVDFYKKGARDAPHLAVICIMTIFNDFVETTGVWDWDTLNRIAERYEAITKDLETYY